MKSNWEKYFPGLKVDSKGQAMVACPFHSDKEPSLSINVDDDICKCFGCGFKGHFSQFQTLIHGGRSEESFFKEGGTTEAKPKYIDLRLVEAYHSNLLESSEHLVYLKEKRLYTDETIERYKMGLDGSQIIMPIFNEKNRIVNLRKYTKEGKRTVYHEKGFGGSYIYPAENLKVKAPLLFLEGEKDALLGNTLGYCAITLTGGADTAIPQKYLKEFRGREVCVCYDLDEAGVRGARKIQKQLRAFAERVFIIHLPEELGEGGDFTDYFRAGYTKEDFDKLFQVHVYDVNLAALTGAEYWNKQVRVVAKVSGKDEIPYLIPKRIRVYCQAPGSKEKRCPTCVLKEEQEYVISDTDPVNLELIQVPSNQQRGILRQYMGAPKSCAPLLNIEIVEGRNVEGVRMVPEKLLTGSGRYVNRQGYYLGQDIEPNMIYELEGMVIPEPKQQYSSFLISKARTEASPLDSMDLDFTPLKIFQVEGNTGVDVKKKMMEFCFYLQQNVTQIYDRYDIIRAVNLVYFTPISFMYENEQVDRGWGDVLILGDSREGKSLTVKRLFNFYGLGEVSLGGKKRSLAGLSGGCSQIGKVWHLQWGQIPLNDRGIFFLDELQDLDLEVFTGLSGIRSEGIAEIMMIKSEKTYARTRLIFTANPRTNRWLRSWSYPIEAVKQFGSLRDIARLDFVVTVGKGEVTAERIRELKQMGRCEEKYPQELWRRLILWAWSRKPEQIKFLPRVEEYIFDVAKEIVEKYESPLPVVKSSEERFVIAKYAIAVAAHLFSTDDKCECIIVNDLHVDFVKAFLNEIFTKESCLYDEYARTFQSRDSLANEEEVREMVSFHGGPPLIEALLTREFLVFTDFQDLLALDRTESRTFISKLVINRALDRKANQYVKTPAFIMLLKAMRGGVPF